MAYKLIFRVHAVQRMFERNMSESDIKDVINNGETIESYPDDVPYPSRLILGWRETKPIHVVIAEHVKAKEIIVITVYEPDPALWNKDFKRRKP